MDDYDEFDPDATAWLRSLLMDEYELWKEIETAKALLEQQGYVVI